MLRSFADDMEPYYQSQFLKEFASILRLNLHKNIINFYGICQSDNWLYILVEDTQKPLKQILLDARTSKTTNPSSFSSLSELFILQTMCELSAAMEVLHTQDVSMIMLKYSIASNVLKGNSSFEWVWCSFESVPLKQIPKTKLWLPTPFPKIDSSDKSIYFFC